MKKYKWIFLASLLAISLTNCNQDPEQPSTSDESNSSTSEVTQPTYERDALLDEDYDLCVDIATKTSEVLNFKEEYADKGFFKDQSGISYEEVYQNNQLKTGTVTTTKNDDTKLLFYSKEKYARFVSKADGYAFTLPANTILKTDFSLGKYRSKVYNPEYTLTISYEHSNPYNNWETYRNEWLFRYLDNENYYTQNNLVKIANPKINDGSILRGYIVDEYDLCINKPLQIKKSYYNIAAIRKMGQFKEFILLVFKSTSDCFLQFQDIVMSFKEIEKEGSANNLSIENLPTIYNEKWNEETKKYYQYLLESNRTDWGAFTATLPTGSISNSELLKSNAYTKTKALSEALDYPFDIIPTYQHIAWNKQTNSKWPETAAKEMAGGNGFNGKPVIQMSYQFTDNNNNVTVTNKTDVYTPMFDIYRGKDGDDFGSNYFNIENKYVIKMQDIARSIKAYGHPVLFRLNNEMNTDWTSYCGMMTLLDPDIFQATWRIIYHIFESEGVDNCIWIFNPIASSCPHSSWGEDMCYYPGLKYVQALGLTSYEFNNDNEVSRYTFRSDYTQLYNKNYPVWKNYPWIISEFACGSGGDANGLELYRNQASQTAYIEGMFADFNDRENHPYLQNIKGAVWFSVNDYVGNKVSNQLELVIDKLPNSIKAMKAGLALNKTKS